MKGKSAKKQQKTPVLFGMLLIQAIDLKDITKNTGANNASTTHCSE
jgi:hypothetical protein